MNIDRIEPTDWYVGINSVPSVQLMVYGNGIGSAEVTTQYPGVTIDSVVRVDSPNYLLVYVDTRNAQPGTMELLFKQGRSKKTVKYQLTASLMATVSPEIADEQYIEWIFPENEILMIQETNDNTLDIAALHKGRVAITARTTDGSNLSATCMVTVLDAGGEDAFYMSDMSALHGDTITIPVAMSSTEPIFAFQTDIYLPDGLFIVTNDGGDYMVTPSSRMTSDHVLMTSNTGDGGVRVMCYSPNEQTFDGMKSPSSRWVPAIRATSKLLPRLPNPPVGLSPTWARHICRASARWIFIDPWGNVTPCNGSSEEWRIGNIKEDSLENILNSDKAREAMKKVRNCKRNCTFIVTERHDMVRRPWVPIKWILKNKWRIRKGLDLCWE